jgi:hypothetical protein
MYVYNIYVYIYVYISRITFAAGQYIVIGAKENFAFGVGCSGGSCAASNCERLFLFSYVASMMAVMRAAAAVSSQLKTAPSAGTASMAMEARLNTIDMSMMTPPCRGGDLSIFHYCISVRAVLAYNATHLRQRMAGLDCCFEKDGGAAGQCVKNFITGLGFGRIIATIKTLHCL